jgi:hypothetical protein
MPAALALITFGSLLVYSSLHGKGLAALLGGDVGEPLDPAGGGGSEVGGDASASGEEGVGTFQGKPVAKWIIPILEYAVSKGWKGRVNSGYRSTQDQARVCATGVKPCATPGKSNHQGKQYPKGAVDVSEAPQLSAILLASKYKKVLVWAGGKDPVHFSHPHGGSY